VTQGKWRGRVRQDEVSTEGLLTSSHLGLLVTEHRLETRASDSYLEGPGFGSRPRLMMFS
jgi:hypothetical protein